MTSIKKFDENLVSVKKKLEKVGISTSIFRTNYRGSGESVSLGRGLFTRTEQEVNKQPTFTLGLNDKRKRLNLNFEYYSKSSKQRAENLEGFSSELKIVASSKKHRQAVLRLKEGARVLTEEGFSFSSYGKKLSDSDLEAVFSVALPENTKYKLIEHSLTDVDYNYYNHSGTVEAHVPASDQYFLIGYDENHMFVSLLPEPVRSISDAHEDLKPQEVVEYETSNVYEEDRTYSTFKAKRQGEFFFIPATEKELKMIEAESIKGEKSELFYVFQDRNLYDAVGNETNHYSNITFVDKNDQFYSCGLISNDRHKPLFLNGWHKVVCNREIPNPTEALWD